MNNRAKTVFFGMVAMAGLLAATPARADHVSVGLGLGDGYGNYFSLGVNSGGRGYGPSHHGDGYGRGYGHGGYGHGGYGYPARPYCAGAVVYAPRPMVYAAPVVYAAPPPVVVQSGYWQEREERTWIEGCWVETTDAYGRRCKMWQPGRWEVRNIREWVQ